MERPPLDLLPPLKPLKVALPSNFGEYQLAAISLVSVICNRRIAFVFVDREDDPAYCDADFVFAEFSPIWGGDNDTWENMLGVIRNTSWFMGSFKEPTAAEAFLRIVYDEHYDGLEDRMALDRIEGRSPYKIAVHLLMQCQQRMSTLLKLQRLRDKMLDALRWDVNSIPTALLFRGGALLDRQVGVRTLEELTAILDKKLTD